MPVYVYKAEDRTCDCDCCNKGVEVLQRMDERPLEKCPNCGRAVKKSISSFYPGIPRTGLDRRAREKGMHKSTRLGKGEYEKVF